jgi:hypothetical protein
VSGPANLVSGAYHLHVHVAPDV